MVNFRKPFNVDMIESFKAYNKSGTRDTRKNLWTTLDIYSAFPISQQQTPAKQ